LKSWKSIILIAGVLLLLASAVVYIFFSKAFQFSGFLALFVPGIILFTAYFLSSAPRVKARRKGPLQAFLLLMILDSLLVAVYGLYTYANPAGVQAPASWAVLVVAVLGFLTYISTLALWHWKRWGLALFQGAAIALAVFILLGGGSLVLAGVIVAGVVILSLLLRSMRKQMN